MHRAEQNWERKTVGEIRELTGSQTVAMKVTVMTLVFTLTGIWSLTGPWEERCHDLICSLRGSPQLLVENNT